MYIYYTHTLLVITAENTLVNFNLPSLLVREDVGVVNTTLYIEVDGSAQLPLMVDLQMNTYDSEFNNSTNQLTSYSYAYSIESYAVHMRVLFLATAS